MIQIDKLLGTAFSFVLLSGVHASLYAQTTPAVIKTFWGPIKYSQLGSKWKQIPQWNDQFDDFAIGDHDFSQPPKRSATDLSGIHAESQVRDFAQQSDSGGKSKLKRDARRSVLRPRSVNEVNLRGVDPMVAVGRNFIMVSQQGAVAFLDKKGKPLPKKRGIPSKVGSSTIFSAFTSTDGPYDINKYSSFTKKCDSAEFPDTKGNKFCVGSVYDTRVYFDALGDRFVIMAQMRNQMATEIYKKGWTNYTDKFGACGTYKSADGVNTAVPDSDYCLMVRRHMVFAISKTADPRDGFHIYAVTENNYRDWPWASVNAEGGVLVLGSRGVEMDNGPALTVFSLEDLRAGESTPRYYKYYPQELESEGHSVAPIVHHGASAGLGGSTLAMTVDKDDSGDKCLKIITLTAPTGQGLKPPLVKDCFKVPVPDPLSLPGWLANTVYRGGYLHMAWSASFPKTPDDLYEKLRQRVHILRIPVQFDQGRVHVPNLSANTPGFRFQTVDHDGTPADLMRRDFAPAISVNAKGSALVSFARTYAPDTEIEVHYVRWNSNDPQPEPGIFVPHTPESGTTPASDKIDFSWGVVDPVDDRTFWFAQDYRWSKAGQNNTLLVRVSD